jgi:endonuclease YncB( thermonuclease family)
MGTLRIEGIIDINQFWPIDSSDADTTKIKLEVKKNSFSYRPTGSQNFRKTKVFEGAKSRGKVTKEVITTSKKTGVRTITVRLQGVDAPELHYKASPLAKKDSISSTERNKFNKINEERRQNFAESATVALAKHLKQFIFKSQCVKAVFETEIATPNQAVDTYGRFVGTVYVGKNRGEVNIWLMENGWVLPAFYTSMGADEINGLLDAWKKGEKRKNKPASTQQIDVNEFDWDLLYRRPKKDDPIKFKQGEDKGRVMMPKLYRRQVAWMVGKKAKVYPKSMSFTNYLKTLKDQYILLDDFMINALESSTVLPIHELISSTDKIKTRAEDMIIFEAPSKLINARGNLITKWS